LFQRDREWDLIELGQQLAITSQGAPDKVRIFMGDPILLGASRGFGDLTLKARRAVAAPRRMRSSPSVALPIGGSGLLCRAQRATRNLRAARQYLQRGHLFVKNSHTVSRSASFRGLTGNGRLERARL
jgi:hypothetical protein